MSDQSHLKDGIATPVLTVIVALVFVVVLFSKFVDWVGPSSGGLVSHGVGKATSTADKKLTSTMPHPITMSWLRSPRNW